jgi:hypothetical protein
LRTDMNLSKGHLLCRNTAKNSNLFHNVHKEVSHNIEKWRWKCQLKADKTLNNIIL